LDALISNNKISQILNVGGKLSGKDGFCRLHEGKVYQM